MAQQGAALQNYNNELVKCLEELCERRTLLEREISRQEEEKAGLERQMKELQSKLNRVSQGLSDKVAELEQYNKTIQQTEQGYARLLESSQMLLTAVKQEAIAMKRPSTTSVGASVSAAMPPRKSQQQKTGQ